MIVTKTGKQARDSSYKREMTRIMMEIKNENKQI